VKIKWGAAMIEDTFTCTSCRIPKVKSKMRTDKNKRYGINEKSCKKCHCDYAKLRQVVRRAEEDPDKYKFCDDCDHIFCKHDHLGNMPGKESYDFKNCPKCKSSNIFKY